MTVITHIYCTCRLVWRSVGKKVCL